MTTDEKKALVNNTEVVTLNGFPARLLGWHNEEAQILCFPGIYGRPRPTIKEASFSWEDAARIVAEGGKFTTSEDERDHAETMPGSEALEDISHKFDKE